MTNLDPTPIPDDTSLPDELPELVIDNVPVVKPGETVTNWAALSAVVVPVITMLCVTFEVPLDKEGMLTLVSAWGVISGLIVWIRNRWFRKSITITSLDAPQVKALRRVRR